MGLHSSPCSNRAGGAAYFLCWKDAVGLSGWHMGEVRVLAAGCVWMLVMSLVLLTWHFFLLADGASVAAGLSLVVGQGELLLGAGLGLPVACSAKFDAVPATSVCTAAVIHRLVVQAAAFALAVS